MRIGKLEHHSVYALLSTRKYTTQYLVHYRYCKYLLNMCNSTLPAYYLIPSSNYGVKDETTHLLD